MHVYDTVAIRNNDITPDMIDFVPPIRFINMIIPRMIEVVEIKAIIPDKINETAVEKLKKMKQ